MIVMPAVGFTSLPSYNITTTDSLTASFFSIDSLDQKGFYDINSTIGVVLGTGIINTTLKRLNIQYTTIENFTLNQLSGFSVIFIDRDAYMINEDLYQNFQELKTYVALGGIVISLAMDSIGWQENFLVHNLTLGSEGINGTFTPEPTNYALTHPLLHQPVDLINYLPEIICPHKILTISSEWSVLGTVGGIPILLESQYGLGKWIVSQTSIMMWIAQVDADKDQGLGINLLNFALSNDPYYTSQIHFPSISDVSYTLGNETATIRWTTNDMCIGKIRYGKTKELWNITRSYRLTQNHTINLTLENGENYYFEVISTNLFAKEAIDNNSGKLYNFTDNPREGLIYIGRSSAFYQLKTSSEWFENKDNLLTILIYGVQGDIKWESITIEMGWGTVTSGKEEYDVIPEAKISPNRTEESWIYYIERIFLINPHELALDAGERQEGIIKVGLSLMEECEDCSKITYQCPEISVIFVGKWPETFFIAVFLALSAIAVVIVLVAGFIRLKWLERARYKI